MNDKEKIPLWLSPGLPLVLIIGGIIGIVTKTFFIAGGSRGGTSKLNGLPAVYFGLSLVCMGIFFYCFVSLRNAQPQKQSVRIITWVTGLGMLLCWGLMGVALSFAK